MSLIKTGSMHHIWTLMYNLVLQCLMAGATIDQSGTHPPIYTGWLVVLFKSHLTHTSCPISQHAFGAWTTAEGADAVEALDSGKTRILVTLVDVLHAC